MSFPGSFWQHRPATPSRLTVPLWPSPAREGKRPLSIQASCLGQASSPPAYHIHFTSVPFRELGTLLEYLLYRLPGYLSLQDGCQHFRAPFSAMAPALAASALEHSTHPTEPSPDTCHLPPQTAALSPTAWPGAWAEKMPPTRLSRDDSKPKGLVLPPFQSRPHLWVPAELGQCVGRGPSAGSSPESPENQSSLGTSPLAFLAEPLLQQTAAAGKLSLFPEGCWRKGRFCQQSALERTSLGH